MNNELIERIDQEIQNLMGQRDVIERLLPNNTAVRELTQIIKVLKDCKAALSEPVAEPQDSMHKWEMAGHAMVKIPDAKPLPAYHEAIGWNDCRNAMITASKEKNNE